MACDIDKSSLSKLWHLTPKNLRKNLSVQQFNINNTFPHPSSFFDIVFCTGVLHLFSEKDLNNHIFPEFRRVLKKSGRVILDFAYDIKRIHPNGKMHYAYPGEKIYTKPEAEKLIKRNFPKVKKMIFSFVHDDLTKTTGLGYDFSCGFLVADLVL